MAVNFRTFVGQSIAVKERGMRLLIALTIWLLASYTLRPLIFHTDDAFITYQYAHNLASGFGYVYHPQFLPLQGSSAPLHVALLAFMRTVLPIPVDELGFLLGALGTGFLAFVLSDLVLTGSDMVNSWRITCLKAAAPFTFFTASMLSFGLEAIWAALLLVMLGVAVAKGRVGFVATTASLLVLTRPDWAFFLLPAGLAALIFHGRRSVLWWIPASMLILFYFCASYAYFGEAFPFTWLAKLHIPEDVSGTLSWLTFMRNFWGAAISLAAYSLTVAFALFAWQSLPTDKRRLLIVFLLMLGFAIIYTLILRWKGAPMMQWYFVSVVTMAAALAMIALSTLSRGILTIFVPLIVASHVLAFTSTSQATASPVNKRGHEDRREVVGRWIADNDSEISTRSIVAFEVGKIAFYTQAKVYDILGLVTREGVEGMKIRDSGLLVRTIHPDYVVGCDCPEYMPMKFIKNPWFREKYKVVYSRDDYRVWKRLGGLPVVGTE